MIKHRITFSGFFPPTSALYCDFKVYFQVSFWSSKLQFIVTPPPPQLPLHHRKNLSVYLYKREKKIQLGLHVTVVRLQDQALVSIVNGQLH